MEHVAVARLRFTGTKGAAHDLGAVAVLGRTGNDRDRPNARRERVDRANHLERQLRQAVAEALQGEALEHHKGGAPKGGRVAALLRFDQGIGELVLRAPVNTHLDLGQVEFGSVRPNAANRCDRALAKRVGGVAQVAVAGHLRAAPATLATLALRTRHFLEARRPDQMARRAHRAVGARNGGALPHGGDGDVLQTRAFHRVVAQHRAVDRVADQAARRPPERRARSAEQAAHGRADGGKDHGRHEFSPWAGGSDGCRRCGGAMKGAARSPPHRDPNRRGSCGSRKRR